MTNDRDKTGRPDAQDRTDRLLAAVPRDGSIDEASEVGEDPDDGTESVILAW